MKKRILEIPFFLLILTCAALAWTDIIYIKVKTNTANIRQNPDITSPVVIIVTKGSILEAEEQQGDWFRVRLSTGERGTILNGYISSLVVDKIVIQTRELAAPPPTQNRAVPPSPSQMFATEKPKVFRERFSIFASGNVLFFSDHNYTVIYPNSQFIPEARLNVSLNDKFYLWGSYATFSATGYTTPNLRERTHSSQTYISAGIGLLISMGRSLSFNLRGGVLIAMVDESAIGSTESANAYGLSAEGGLRFNFAKRLFMELGGGYLSATLNKFEEPVLIGGLRAGGGLGFSF